MVISGIRNSMRLPFEKTTEEESTRTPSSVAETRAPAGDTVSISDTARMLAER